MNNAMGPNRIHPQVLSELANVLAGLFLIILKSLWRLGEMPENWKKENITTVHKKEETEPQASQPHFQSLGSGRS